MDHQIPGLMVNTEGYVTKTASGAGPAISYPTASAPVAPAAPQATTYAGSYGQQQQSSYNAAPVTSAPAAYNKPPVYGGGYGAAAAPAPRADTNQNIVPINAINPYSSR